MLTLPALFFFPRIALAIHTNLRIISSISLEKNNQLGRHTDDQQAHEKLHVSSEKCKWKWQKDIPSHLSE